jgi:thiamine-phosphate pyrophosphorylase
MRRRQSLPRLWLMTDERQGKSLRAAVERLPAGSGIVFRHYRMPAADRGRIFADVLALARRRGLTVLVAGLPLPGGDGVHNRRGRGIRSMSAHNLRELKAAERAGADLVFLSPVFATRSHPGAASLGATRFNRLARMTHLPVIALGGMDAARFRSLPGAWGWAGIDALTPEGG